MLSRKLAISSALALSIASAVLVGTPFSVQAGNGGCGDSPLPCNETQQPNQSKVRINYTIENKTKRTIKFALPSGKIYQLAPGQRGAYQNTVTPDRFRLFLFAENKFYPLANGNYQFRQNANGQISLIRVLPHQKTGVRRSRPTPPSRTPTQQRTRTPVTSPQPPVQSPLETPSPEFSNPELSNPELSNPEVDGNAQSETILPLLIDKVGDVLIELIQSQPATDNTSTSSPEDVQTIENSGSVNDGADASPEEAQPSETTNPEPSGEGVNP
jgi:hypothetical protein